MAQNKRFDLDGVNDNPSKIDLLSGKHTTSLIVAILFLVTLIGLIIVVCSKDNLSDNVVTGLIGLLGMLTGFFAGNKKEMNK